MRRMDTLKEEVAATGMTVILNPEEIRIEERKKVKEFSNKCSLRSPATRGTILPTSTVASSQNSLLRRKR